MQERQVCEQQQQVAVYDLWYSGRKRLNFHFQLFTLHTHCAQSFYLYSKFKFIFSILKKSTLIDLLYPLYMSGSTVWTVSVIRHKSQSMSNQLCVGLALAGP